MAASVDNESEILLGNKQLLAVFGVVAILLAIAFTTGYMLGKNSGEKKAGAASDAADSSTAAAKTAGGPITQKVSPDDARPVKTEAPPVEEPMTKTTVVVPKEERAPSPPIASGVPKPGQNFVQVTAVPRKIAEDTADVLRDHGFPARIAPAPGSQGVFRVLVGPAKDAAELRNMADKLRKIGYTKCFIQHY